MTMRPTQKWKDHLLTLSWWKKEDVNVLMSSTFEVVDTGFYYYGKCLNKDIAELLSENRETSISKNFLTKNIKMRRKLIST